ncbi:MAG: competence/damage-inducible protein A [Candidatus Limnocylindrales bacterium]
MSLAKPSDRIAHQRHIRTAELLAIGTELTTGDTRDTNGGDLARELTALGVEVERMTALPDDLAAVTSAFVTALTRVDLTISTGGLGPTPDDLTREAIAAACQEHPEIDPDLEAGVRSLFEGRGMTMADLNRKQAWLIPSAHALANPNGTAPGWWVERPDGRIVAALPGPPAEMRPMWWSEVLPRLQARGLGADRAVRTLRLAGIGESAAAEIIGEEMLRGLSPIVATYAKADSVDVRVTAGGGSVAGAGPVQLVEAALAELERRLDGHIFARDDEGWIEAIGGRLQGRRLATAEIGTDGQLTALLGGAPWLLRAETLAGDARLTRPGADLQELATQIRASGGAEVGLAVEAEERQGDTAVTIAVATAAGVHEERRTAFSGGREGRRRAAVIASTVLWERLATA